MKFIRDLFLLDDASSNIICYWIGMHQTQTHQTQTIWVWCMSIIEANECAKSLRNMSDELILSIEDIAKEERRFR